MSVARTFACALLLGGITMRAGAQPPSTEPASDTPMQTVVVTLTKDPDLLPYTKIYEKMQEFETIKERDKIYLRFFAAPKGDAELSKLKMSLASGGANMPIDIEPDGTIQFPVPAPGDVANAAVLTNQRGNFKIHYGPGIKVPESESFRYRDVMDGVKQSTTMMKKFWSFLFPSFKGAGLRYAEANGQYAIIHARQGDIKIDVVPARKSIPLELDSSLYEENPLVTVSQRPVKISPFNVSPSR